MSEVSYGYLKEAEDRIADLEAENERLENLLAEGVHSCSQTCKRPLCQLRREKARLEQQLADLRAACEQKQEIINSFAAVDKARREENSRMERELDTLREAAELYMVDVWHYEACPSYDGNTYEQCTCGYTALKEQENG